ncbi:hypothetical protein ScPMuIL_013768 [Solemya velum]
MEKWRRLLDKLESRKLTLSGFSNMMAMFREIESIQEELKEVENKVKTEDYGKHLMATEDYIQQHSLQDAQVHGLAKRVRNLNRRSKKVTDSDHPEGQFLEKRLNDLNEELNRIKGLSDKRKNGLAIARKLFKFLQDSEEEDRWVQERIDVCKSSNLGKDLNAALMLIKKHEAMEAEMQGRWPRCEEVCATGQDLVNSGHGEQSDIGLRIRNLMDKWKQLRDLAASRKLKLDDAIESQQYYADANEAESWMKEKMPLVCSDDYGRDEASAQALLSRHNRLDSEIKAFNSEIKRLDELAQLMTKAASEHNISPAKFLTVENGEREEEEEMVEDVVDVPHEIEVEELVEREVLQDVMETRKVPQVKAMYNYTGQGIKVNKGEILLLVQRSNPDWWHVRRDDETEGFVPANYVKDTEPKVIQKIVKKPTKVQEKVKVRKTVMKKEVVKRKNEDANKLRRAPSVRSKANLHFDKDNVETRQKAINLSYGKLLKLAQARKISLDDATKLFKFYRECDEFEVWMKEKEVLLASKESLADNMDAVRKKFENLLTSLAANKCHLNTINKLAEEIIKAGSSQREKVRRRQKEINDRWDKLNQIKMEKEKKMQGASSIKLFTTTCDDLAEWIKDKESALTTEDLGKDMKAIQLLQRKHANLERELVPVEEKMKRMDYLADSVKSAYPDESPYVDHRQGELHQLWNGLKDKANKRKASLDDHEDKQRFNEDAKDLMTWSQLVRAKLARAELPRDVASAERLLKEHDDLQDDVAQHKPKFEQIRKLGNNVLGRSPQADQDIKDKMQKLDEDEKAIDDACKKRKKQLTDQLHLQEFNREADNLDSVTSGHERFLKTGELGDDADVDSMSKRHEDLLSTLQAQDEKMKALNDFADRLIADGHPDASHIDQRRKDVIAARDRVKAKAAERQNALKGAQGFQGFKRKADELSSWVREKHKMATDESYRDLGNLKEKLKKHQAFELELKANNDRLGSLNEEGNDMINSGHEAAPQIKDILGDLNSQWRDLVDRSEDKGRKLRQASQQHTLNRALSDAQGKLDQMQKSVNNPEVGSDLRSVKELIKKHQMLENDLLVLADNIQGIVSQGQALAEAGHFDKAGILKAVDTFNKRFEQLKPDVARRKQNLQDSLHFHQFKFDTDEELQWIKEHLPAASLTDYGKSQVDAQNLHKKHQKLELEIQGHHPIKEKVLATGDRLIDERHSAAKQIKDKCQELQVSWDDLCNKAKIRKKNLDLSVQIQKYLSEVAEIEAWINEKMALVTSTDYGKDEDAADKLLTKNKVLETDIQTYQGIVSGLGKEAQRLFKIGCQDPTTLRKAQDNLQDYLNKLKRLAAERSRNLEQSKWLHSYTRECNDLEDWIGEQLLLAGSEEYGQDYEHLVILRDKFDEFKRTVDAGYERFNRCERLSKWLLEDKSPYEQQVQERQTQLGESWNVLLEQIEARDIRLHGAGEIHRFNRDVEDALTRIQEKYSSIPDDLGRDLNATQSYLKKHEGFENELVALEAQLQVLVEDSARLQQAYPGENAEQIEHLQATVVQNWRILQERAAQRKEELLAAADLHRFLADVRDLLGWASEIEHEMRAENPVRDMNSVDLLRKRHAELKAEIEARDDTFTAIAKTGEAMIENGHYASDEIREKVNQVLEVRERLLATWTERKNHHEQLFGLHTFLRDAQALETTSSSQEAYLASPDFGSTVDQVDNLKKKHEAFEKVLAVQEEKLEAIQQHGTQLVQSKNFDHGHVEKTLRDVTARRANIKEQSAARTKKLGDSMLYVQFNRDVVEAEGWIDDKLKVAYEDNFEDVTDLYDKMKKLQKHQAFEAEIRANTDLIDRIKEQGDVLVKKKHPATDQIRQNLQRLLSKWNELLQASANRGKGLGEVKDILEFNEQVDKVEMWIREKEALVSAGDLGKDYEHCCELQKKVNDQESAGITVDETRIKAINTLAEKLITQGRTDTAAVKHRRDDINKKWRALQGALNAYKQKLSASLEIHAFNRDVDDVNDRINEKAMLLSTDDVGKDLAAVESLQRKQEEIERDMTALQNQLEKIETMAGKLCRKYPDDGISIQNKKKEAEDNWEKLEDLCDIRKSKLAQSYDHQKFMTDARELISWSNDMIQRMNTGDLAKDVTEAETLLQMHHERKAEIDGRKPHFAAVREHGNRLVTEKHYACEEIQKTVGQLDKTKLSLSHEWDKRNLLLTQCHDLQVFKETAEQAEGWLASREAFLANEDLGNTLYGVESLLRKHEAFEKTTKAQQDRIDDLKQFASDLKEKDHYAANEIKERCQAVVSRTEHFWEHSKARRKKLEDSKQYQLFLKNTYDVSGWIQVKLQVALDDSYRDLTNLQAKLQKHQAFEAEVTANRNRVDLVNKEGQVLLDQAHYANADIKKRLEELELSWQALMAASMEKKERLQDAYQALMFNRVVEDLVVWMDGVENQLLSEDHGKDLISVNNLLKKQQMLEQDVANHQEKVQDVTSAAAEFKENKHFMYKELQAKAKDTSDRYNSLMEPCHILRENLEDASLMYQYYRDVEDEMAWIREKKPIAGLTDLGSSLSAVQNLMKKHQALESEIVAHEPLIDAVANAAQHMVKSKHFASQDIENKLEELHIELQQLKALASERKLKLHDSLESQKFYTEIFEAESWMNEKIPVLTSSDLGKDEDSVQGLLKKLDALERDIDNFSNNIGELAALSRSLVDRGHYDSENIKSHQAAVENKYSKLQDLTNQRRAKLNDSKKLFEFYREANEVSTWIMEKGNLAASEDYGQDLEHVEILQQKFEDFLHETNAGEESVTSIHTMAKVLIDAEHFESEKIKLRSQEIQTMWTELKDVAQGRREALASAKQVHTYGRDADDTLEWIQEKDGIVTSEDFGHDLESVRTLVSRHEVLEGDLAAISDQVEKITKEAERLIALFPDAQEHIAGKHEEMVQAWNKLVERATLRKEKLQQAEQLQMYFNDYRELTAWISEMMAIITSEELARDLPGAEIMITRCKEHHAEIESKRDAVNKFQDTGKAYVDQGHFMSEEILEKTQDLGDMWEGLLRTFQHHKKLCDQNLEAQQMKHEMELLEGWMSIREPQLREKNMGESIAIVEELIRRQEDFEKTVDAQDEKFRAITRRTKLEQELLDQEEQRKAEDIARKELDRLEEIRNREQQRIMEDRKREESARKAHEVLLRRQIGEDNDSDEGKKSDDRLDKATVKNLIGRSQSIKTGKSETSETDVRRAISFRNPGVDGPASPTAVLVRAVEFREGEGVVKKEEEENAPCLPSAPPPTMPASPPLEKQAEPTGALSKKEKLSSPQMSPKAKRVDIIKEEKKSKRTPSFNIRKRTRSFKDKYKLPEDLPPVELEGDLERKQELQSGGRRATIRSWKSFHSVLFGQLLCFFKDRETYLERAAAAPPLNIHAAHCEIASDYTKKKNVLRLKVHDGSEFLLETSSASDMEKWLSKINFYAAQPPMHPNLDLYQSLETNESTDDPGALSPDEQFTSFEDKTGGSGDRTQTSTPNKDAHASQIHRREPSDPISTGSGSPRTTSTEQLSMRVDSVDAPSRHDDSVERTGSFNKESHTSQSFSELNSSREQYTDHNTSSDTVGSTHISMNISSVPENVEWSDPDHDVSTEHVQHRPRPVPRTTVRPISEPVPMGAFEDHDHEEKKEKRKSMFGFLKKKKEKDHEEHKDHKEKEKDHKKHRRESQREKVEKY